MNNLKEIIVENMSTNKKNKLNNISDLKSYFEDNPSILNFINFNQKRFDSILENSYNCFVIENWQITLIAKKKTTRKKKGNGQGSTYFDNTRQCWVGQYIHNSKKKFIYQRKNETKTQFLARFNELLVSIGNGTYIEKRNDTLKTIIEKYIRQKFDDGTTKGRTYKRDKETLSAIEKHCGNFINKPIQQVTLYDIQSSKLNLKHYSQSEIDKMWRFFKKAFAIASSPSIKLIPYNIMNDENLKKPISNKPTKKILPLTTKERERLAYVLDNEEKNHKYRNIVKMEWLTAMRIGETLARSKKDIINNKTIIYIHNTLTEDEYGNIIIGEHTKTYNKTTGIDNGKRNFPISQELKEIINMELSKNLTNIHGLLFWDYEKNTFISDSEVNSWLARINKKYNISNKTIHNHRLRHDRITQWKEAGMDMDAIQYFAGHVEGSSVTSNVYIDISEEYAFKELKKIVN